ncbi:MAG: hypothetical protein A2857_04690 [Candidatus Levybacteria bacterium RIFCSPHIGHO2_01_FULL_36_15]|nr:MAG: hypothetical protein A2857_04690 [Candidatus Levybacteria bacterium RIFCSPHIGHO2_01_FULL_36_15]
MECRTCLSLSGEKPLFPESRMYEGKYWVVEHAYPVSIKGWIVVMLKRHCEALHELTQDEFKELAFLQEKIAKTMHTILKSKKEYIACFAEGKGFNHLHLHLIAKPQDLPEEFKGSAVFSLLKVKEENISLREDIINLCKQIRKYLENSGSE